MEKQMNFDWDQQAKFNSQPLDLEDESLPVHMQRLASKATNLTEPALWFRVLQEQIFKTGKYTPFLLDEVKIVSVCAKLQERTVGRIVLEYLAEGMLAAHRALFRSR